MQIISPANETILKILKNFKRTSDSNRILKYCMQRPVDEGVLLFNLLTREMVLLTEEEHSHLLEQPYLKDRWFVVPEDTNEKSYASFVRVFLKRQQKQDCTITGYTIFTTMDCNARCFYCYELGRSRSPMSQETALKVVQYIKAHCGGKKVQFTWYGGEPLYNQTVIDTICQGLHRERVEYRSTVISNGYLFNEATVKKAVESWNVKRVQITLDGTEEIYNRVKAYIYKDGNPYQIVLNNIERLLDASVQVCVRMNMDMYNAEDLLAVVEELGRRFGGRKNLMVYAYHLFKQDQTLAERHSAEEWKKREAAMTRIEQQIERYGFTNRGGIPHNLRMYHCMADSDQCVTILPDGHIGKCDHYSESEFAGHLDQEGLDQGIVAKFKETVPENPECANCFYYPECVLLRMCSYQNVCFPQYRQSRERLTQRRMLNEYRNYQNHTVEEDDDPIPSVH